MTHDVINHPPHYTAHPSGVECIQITEHMGFNLGNAVKYIWRADEKGEAIEDLEKAAWYIDRELARRKVEAHDEPIPSIADWQSALVDKLQERLDEPFSHSDCDDLELCPFCDDLDREAALKDWIDLTVIEEDETLTFRLGEFLPDVSLSISRATS